MKTFKCGNARPIALVAILALLAALTVPGVAFAATNTLALSGVSPADDNTQEVTSGWNEVFENGNGKSYGWKLFATVTISNGKVTDVVIKARGNNMPNVPEMEQPYFEPCHYYMEERIIDADVSAADTSAIDGIDVVSGATHTSNTIKKAVKEALTKWGTTRIEASTIALSPAKVTFNGKAQTPAVTVTNLLGTKLVEGTDYAVDYANNTNAGAATVTVTAVEGGAYAGSAAATFTIDPAQQAIAAAKATYKVKLKKVKKKKQTVAVKFNANGGGKVTYAAAKKGKVSIAKNGKVTVKKGAKKGTYTLKVKVTAAANGNYAKTTATVPLKIKVG